MKNKTVKKRLMGSISILLIIILMPTMLLSGIIVDTSRVNIGKASIANAGDLAMSSALADYDTIIKDVYGLFAMSQTKTEDELTNEIREYFEKTLVSYGVCDESEAGTYLNSLLGEFNSYITGTGNAEISSLLGMEVQNDFSVERLENSSLANPDIMRKQIVDYMKFRAPVNMGMSIFDSVKSFTSVKEQSDVIVKQVEAQESLQDVTDGCKVTIDEIRRYDALLNDVQYGTTKVTGSSTYEDGVIVPIENYELQILKYRNISSDWNYSYQHINRLMMIFLLKPPSTDDVYLKKMKTFDTSKYFVTSSDINTNNSGINISVSCASDNSGAKAEFDSQKAKLLSGTYYNIATNYRDWGLSGNVNNFVDESYIAADNKRFTDGKENEAIESFVRFERFLLDDDDAVIKYSQVKETFEELFKFKKYYDNYSGKLKDIEKEKKKAMDDAKDDLDDAEEELSKLENKLNAAEEDLDDAKADIAAAEADYNSAKTQSEKSKALSAKSSAENRKSQAESKISSLSPQVDAQRNAVNNQYTPIYNQKKSEYELAKATRENCEAEYKNCISNYIGLCNNYISDLNDYDRYKEVAENVIRDEFPKIADQFNRINSNLLTLTGSLENVAVYLSQIKLAVKAYDGNVEAWKTENANYEAKTGGKDTFSAGNTAEIISSKKDINENSIENLITYVDSIAEEYRTLYNFIVDDTTKDFVYYDTKIFNITEYGTIQRIANTQKNALPDIVTVADADGKFDEMFKNTHSPTVFNDLGLKLSLIKPDMIPLDFLRYLNDSYPESPADAGISEEDKVQTETLISNLKTENNGESINDGDDYTSDYSEENASVAGNSLGYTYMSGKDLNGDSDLPTNIERTLSGDVTAKELTIKTGDKDKINVSDSITDSNTLLGDILDGVKNVAGTSLENIYIMDYLFENFSYNTMLQEAVIAGEASLQGNEATLLAVKGALSDSGILAKYNDKQSTLSNVPINAYNNYLYGAEVEYVVYGDKNPVKNVTSTKASIYAIRSIFNMVFAFTNAEIRNETRTIAISIQAATCGIVPYQAIQVVLQLALAFAESAIDLSEISNGMKVVLVKSIDTWNLSLQSAAHIAGDYVADAVSQLAHAAVSKAGEALQNVVDAGADKLGEALSTLSSDLAQAVDNELDKLVGQAFSYMENKLFAAMDTLQFTDFNGTQGTLKDGLDKTKVMTQSQVLGEVDRVINQAIQEFKAELPTELTGIPLADDAFLSLVITEGEKVANEFREEVKQTISDNYLLEDGFNNVTEIICNEINKLEVSLLAKIKGIVGGSIVQGEINKIKSKVTIESAGKINVFISNCTGELSEEAALSIKENVTSYTNSFIDKYLPSDSTSGFGKGVNGGGSGSESIASIIKFGYKDYLMLFAFIEISTPLVKDGPSPTGSDKMLTRMADLIQLNVQNASKEAGASYEHKKGQDFLLNDARTYVSVSGSVKMDTLFFDMDFFKRSYGTMDDDIDTTLSKYGTIKYTGLSGY